jgi:valyl-tRNA synthetase
MSTYAQVKASIKSLQEDFPTGIPQCGSDALRFGLLAYTVQGNDVNLDIKRVVGYRQFCNKIWNAIKFALTYVNDFEPSPAMVKEVLAAGSPAGTRDRAILSSLNRLVGDVNTKMAAYVFGDVVQDLYAWFMDQFCDVYLELVKPVVFDETDANAPARRCVKITLYHCLETYLRLIHPMMPFVSEELWQRLPNKTALTQVPSIMISPYPESDDAMPDANAEADLALVIDAVRSARHTKVECNIPPRATPTFYYIATGAAAKSMVGLEKDFCTLVKPGSFGPAPATPPASCTVTIVNQDLQLLMDMAGSIDKTKEGARLTKEIARLEPELDKYERKIKEAEYSSKVPLKVQELNTAKISSLKAELETVRAALLKLDAM